MVLATVRAERMGNSMAYINRDPFARTELHRKQTLAGMNAANNGTGCDWCGSYNRNGKLYRYSTESDGGSKYEHKGMFCSKSCHDSYHS